MVQWAAFGAITGVVLVLLLVLSHLTQSAFTDDDGTDDPFESTPFESAMADGEDRESTETPTEEEIDLLRVESTSRESTVSDPPERERDLDPESLSTGMVLANVAVSQGLFALVLLGAVLYTGVPAAALGVEFSWAYVQTGLVIGTATGVVLYIANEIAAALATHAGFSHDEQLRELLAPESAGGWTILLGGVLPIIAVFEELLFRAALIGALAVGFAIDPWLLAVGSSIAFALGHGIQGRVGILVTGALGFVLAALFIQTGSLLVVVVAHYWINALEFVVHERFELEWAETLGS